MILYELLAGKLPYSVARVAIHEAVRMVQEVEPTKLSTTDRRLRGDIETITLKALEKDRDRRYQSATALEEDIVRYLAGDPIACMSYSTPFQKHQYC
jgi:serine/threonine protein kinase